MAKIKVKQTLVGEYGRALVGEEIDVREKVADRLVSNGLAEYITLNKPDTKGTFDKPEHPQQRNKKDKEQQQ